MKLFARGLVSLTLVSAVLSISSYQGLNQNNPFIYSVPPVLSIIATNPYINKSQVVFNEPFETEKREEIGGYHYHRAKECGIHFLNLQEGYIISDKMFPNGDKPPRCMWGFVGNHFCTPSVECPKFIERKKKADCRGNYLQITDDESFSYHFCHGFSTPGKRVFTAAGGVLDITFRYASLYERPQFECLVRCVPYESNFTTSTNARNQTVIEFKNPKKPFVSKLLHPRMLQDCKCGVPNSQRSISNSTESSLLKHFRVLGGRETEVSQYPWMAGLVHKEKKLPFCGASLINDRYVLTAAHCLDDEELGDFQVILNEHDYFNDSETPGKTVTRNIMEMIRYQYYLDSTFYGDMALLTLDIPVDVTKFTMTPVCLPRNTSNSYANYDVIGAGWGTLTENGQKSPKLLEVLLKVIPNEGCNDYHSSTKPEPPQVTDNMMCAGYPEGGRDTCSGDSGGPLVTFENDRFTQVGVTSWGFGCGIKHNPGMFARVTSFLNWIQMHTPDAIWCH